jgi:predicted transcriptional regulator
MKTIQEQVSLFLSLAGISANRLSVASGVHRSTLCKVLSGKQPDVTHKTACSLFEAMKLLDPEAARKAMR